MKIFKNKLAVTASVLSVAFISLIVYSEAKRDNIAIINQVKEVAYSANGVFYGLTKSARNAVIAIVNYNEIEKENEDLKKENSKLKGNLSGYKDLLNENKTLRSASSFKETRQEYDYIGADVLQVGKGEDPNILILNQGSKDGVFVGLAVIDPSSGAMVGTVSKVGKDHSLVETIKHENSKIAVKVKTSKETPADNVADDKNLDTNLDNDGNNENIDDSDGSEQVESQDENLDPEGTLNGYGATNIQEGDGEITMIPIKSEIEKGSDVFTTGRGFFYPKDIIIGTIVSITENKGESTKILEMKSLVDFDRLQQVLIVLPKGGVVDKGEIAYDK